MVTLTELQKRHKEWEDRNFPNPDPVDSLRNGLLGMQEELGELAHSHLKMKQGIRGTKEEHLAGIKDAIADVTIYALGVCNKNGWNIEECMTIGSRLTVNLGANPTDNILWAANRFGGLVNSQLNGFKLMGQKRMGWVLLCLEDIASHYGWNYGVVVAETCQRVFARDWVADPTAGGEGTTFTPIEPLTGGPDLG